MPDELRFNDVPIHILAGELDDWVPAASICIGTSLNLSSSGIIIHGG
jgi:hypothetical protein